MPKFHLTNKAVEDLSDIWEYTYAEWSEEQADFYYEFLLSTCQELANKTSLGKNYSDVESNLLGYLANRHIIFYKTISKTEIEVIRILHSSMDLKSRIAE